MKNLFSKFQLESQLLMIWMFIMIIVQSGCGPSAQEQAQAEQYLRDSTKTSNNMTLKNDITTIESVIVQAKEIEVESGVFSQTQYYKKNGHLFFGDLDGNNKGFWLIHDPDCPKCLKRLE
jgi:hypothetical protein